MEEDTKIFNDKSKKNLTSFKPTKFTKSTKMIDIYKKIRKTWTINPRTRLKGNDKVYNRDKIKQKFRRELQDDY